MKVYKRRRIVDARQCAESEVVLTAHGRVRAEPGDWVLSDPETGDTWPIKPDIFANTYVEVPDLPLGTGLKFASILLEQSEDAPSDRIVVHPEILLQLKKAAEHILVPAQQHILSIDKS